MKSPVLTICKKCGKSVLPHIVCLNCGYYKGVEVIDVLKKLNKKERKAKEQEMKSGEEDKSSSSPFAAARVKEAEEKGGKEKSLSWEGLSKTQ